MGKTRCIYAALNEKVESYQPKHLDSSLVNAENTFQYLVIYTAKGAPWWKCRWFFTRAYQHSHVIKGQSQLSWWEITSPCPKAGTLSERDPILLSAGDHSSALRAEITERGQPKPEEMFILNRSNIFCKLYHKRRRYESVSVDAVKIFFLIFTFWLPYLRVLGWGFPNHITSIACSPLTLQSVPLISQSWRLNVEETCIKPKQENLCHVCPSSKCHRTADWMHRDMR